MGYQCPVSGCYDESARNIDENQILAVLETAHIIPHAVGHAKEERSLKTQSTAAFQSVAKSQELDLGCSECFCR